MLPVLLIHGYSSEGRNTSAADIYGSLPRDLAAEFGDDVVVEIDLSRWISVQDGIGLDDVSFALDRALRSPTYRHLLRDGFHAVIHSTGALVLRNWLRLYSPRPSPLANLVHLAGANFGSGLAHIGRGQLARWGRLLFMGTGRGVRVLDELEFGAGKTLDMHLGFREPGNDPYEDYQVQEFCLIGSQTLPALRVVPIRYVKEDSSDSTVRTAAGNLNFNVVRITPRDETYGLTTGTVGQLREQRMNDEALARDGYRYDLSDLAEARRAVPFGVLYETAHFGDSIGILTGKRTRRTVVPLLRRLLSTPYDEARYAEVAKRLDAVTERTQARIARSRRRITDWDPYSQYEAHAQVVFRLRDQFGGDVKEHDITIRSRRGRSDQHQLEKMIEATHVNRSHGGTITFYLRTQRFDPETDTFRNLLQDCRGVDIEITGEESGSDEISYLPLTFGLTSSQIPLFVQNFRTTIVDVTLLRLPSRKVFALSRAGS
jgi:hypothetical protein